MVENVRLAYRLATIKHPGYQGLFIPFRPSAPFFPFPVSPFFLSFCTLPTPESLDSAQIGRGAEMRCTLVCFGDESVALLPVCFANNCLLALHGEHGRLVPRIAPLFGNIHLFNCSVGI